MELIAPSHAARRHEDEMRTLRAAVGEAEAANDRVSVAAG